MRKALSGRAWLFVVAFVCVGLCSGGVSAGAALAKQGANLPAGSQYVAMGSSYAAGFFIKPQEVVHGAGASCGRSLVDYPHLVAAKLHLALDDVSCGGAVTANALNTPQGSAPPQIDAVTSSTRLVTMTIGGNDVNYVGTAIECGLSSSRCVARANSAQIDAAFQALPTSLTKLIQAVRTKAPSAIIVLVTYPRLVPPAPCPALHYTPAAARLVGSMGTRLEQVFVAVAKSDHVLLADPYVLGATHGPCTQGTNQWVAGLVASNGFEYHPTSAGHQEMAHLVEQALGVS